MENYRFVIAEKPSVGMSIAKAIGATTHDEIYLRQRLHRFVARGAAL